MNRKLLATAVAGVIAPMAAQALDVSVSGHVARSIRYADTGGGSDVQHVDHSASPSRFKFAAEGEAMPGLTFGTVQEIGMSSNNGWAVDVDKPDGGSGLSVRHSYVYLSGGFGKLVMGHTAPSGNAGMFEAYNNAWLGTEYSPDVNSGLMVMVVDESGKSVTTDISVGGWLPGVSAGLGRKNVLRYDTPSIGPVTVSGSVFKPDPFGMNKGGAGMDTDHHWSFDVGFSQEFGATAAKGKVFFADDLLGISGGLSFPNGTSVNAAWGTRDYPKGWTNAEGRVREWDYDDIYLSVAHNWGNLSLAMDYRNADWSLPGAGAWEGDATVIGLGANYAVGSGVDVFAGFHNYSFDDNDNTKYEDINSFHIGSRVKFN